MRVTPYKELHKNRQYPRKFNAVLHGLSSMWDCKFDIFSTGKPVERLTAVNNDVKECEDFTHNKMYYMTPHSITNIPFALIS